MVKLEELEKKIKTEELNAIYLFYGEETYLLETIVKKLKTRFGELVPGINYISLDDTNIQNIIAELEAPAFGYEKKLIIIKNADLFKKEGKRKSTKGQETSIKIKDFIEQNSKMIEMTCVLVFIEQEAEKNDLFNYIEKEGIVCNFERLKPIQLEKRLKSICDAYKVNVDNATITYLIENIGTSMQDAINEIRKLIEYAGENGTIKKQDIDELCIKQTEAVIFDLTDYLGSKNVKDAISTLKELIYNKEPIQRLLTLIYNHFKKLYFTKLTEKYNKNLAESLSLKPNQMFLTTKYKKQASYFEERTLREILQALVDLDANYKLGLIDLEMGLEAILCNYCS